MYTLSKLAEANEPKAWLQLIDHLIKTHPNLYYFKLVKAKHLITTGQTAEAKTLIDEYIAQQPKDPDGYLTLGNLFIEENEATSALEQFEKAYQLAPGPGAIGLAAYYRMNEKHIKAEEYFTQALKHFPQDATIHVERGVNFAMMNNLAAAINCWKEALKINPDFGPAKANLERAQVQLNAQEPPRPGPFKRNLPAQSISSH
jgi:tetratricopeptide (TPR) repeat protein